MGQMLTSTPPEITPLVDVVDEINTSVPGIHSTPSERVILELTEQPVLHLISDDAGNPAISDMPVEASLPATSNLTQVYATDVAQSSYGMHSTPLERMILEQTEQPALPQHTDDHIKNVNHTDHLIAENPSISVIHNEASLPATRNLTQVCAADVAQISNVAMDVFHSDVGSHKGINASACDSGQVVPMSSATSQHMTTGAVMNVSKKTLKNPLTAKKREEINARRRANYQKKKEEATVKLQDENQPTLRMLSMAVKFLSNTVKNESPIFILV